MFTSNEVGATELLDLAFDFTLMGLRTRNVLAYSNIDSLQHTHRM